MSVRKTNINPTSGLIAMLTMLSVIIAAYAYYLESVGAALDYQADALEPAWYMFKPTVVMGLIAEGGYLGTLTAVLMNIGHTFFFAAFVVSAITIGFAPYFRPRNQASGDRAFEAAPNPAESGIYPCEIPGSTMMVLIQDSKDPRTGEVIPGVNDTDPFNQTFLRVDRSPIKTARQPSSPVEKLLIAIHELLAAHPTVPASVGHHHADASLRDHSIAISKAVVSFMEERNWQEPLARVAGLAHDLDKLLAYQEKAPGVWVKRKDATHHNTYSAYLVAQQPEFAELPPEDQHTLTMALRYYHHPKMLPVNVGERVDRLITAIRHADGNVIQSEKAAGITAAVEAGNTAEILAKAFEQFLATADINGYKGSQNASGWTKDALEYVIIPMSRIIESVGAFIPADLARQLQLNVDSRSFNHRAIPVLKESLTKLQLLMTTHKGVESPTGLFDVKIGMKQFKACVLLDKDRISDLVPTIVPKWGMTSYTIKVQRPTLDKMQGDAPDEEVGE